VTDADERSEHLQRLARLQLEPGEAEAVAADVELLLGYLERLQEVDVSGEPEWTPPVPPKAISRPDVLTASLPRERALALAPASQDGYFRVPRVLEDT